MNRLIRWILDPLQHDSLPSEDDAPAAREAAGTREDRATTATSLAFSFRRFAVEGLCLLMLLYGAPLQALESNLPKVEMDAPDIPLEMMELSLDSTNRSLETAWQATHEAATGFVQQPWGDTFAMMLTASSLGATQETSSPPSPPSDERSTRDFDLAGLAAGFADKDALDAIPLLPGWNQISLPEVPGTPNPGDSDPATVLAAIGGSYSKVYAFDGCDAADPWKVYDPADPAGSSLTTIDVTQGLLIDATAAVSLPSDGTLPDSTTFQLCTGWNLIGFPSAQPRHVRSAFAPIMDKVVRVFGFDPFDIDDPWAFFEKDAPAWASDLDTLEPGMGYWILVTEDVTLEIKNVGEAPDIAFTSPVDLDVVTAPTEIHGSVASDLLESWQLRYRGVGEADWVDLASGNYPVNGKLGDFDPTLLLNGMYEIELTATDLQGLQVTDSITIVVEGNMKIGHFTLSFIDLAIPLSGLDIEVVRTYDSRQRHLQGDFGYGWSLDIRQGSYRNNRPPGDGWEIRSTEGPWGLPCSRDAVLETKSHLTTIRLSDQEVYRFRLVVEDPGTIIGGCIGRADFEFVDGPIPGATLEILGNTSVLYQNGTNELRDPDTFELFVPEDVKLTTRDGRIFHLDLNDGVTHLEDLNGNTLDITPEGITHSSGRGVEFVRDAEGRIERIIDPMGNANVYGYDAAGELVAFTDRVGAETRFAYTDGHYLEDIVNALGVRAVRTEYDDDGRMVRMIDAAGKVTSFGHDLDNRREVVTNRLGFSRTMEFDGRGNVVREVDELGNTTVRSYDSKDRMLSETNPLDETVIHTYDANGFLTSARDPLGNTTSYTYNSLGSPTTITDPRGKTTSYSYDAMGNLITATGPLGATATFTYDNRGQILTQTDGLGGSTTFTYDDFGNQVLTVDALGHGTTSTYDEAGNLTSQSRQRTLLDGTIETLTTSFAVDALGRVSTSTLPDGSTTHAAYDFLGSLLSSTDPLGHTLQFQYDIAGRQTEIVHADGTVSSRDYDTEGKVVAFTDRGGRTTSLNYDSAGRLVSIRQPDSSTSSNAYDKAGRLIASTDPLGATTSYAYDAAGQRTKVIDALGHTTTYTYDPSGNPIRVSDPLGQAKAFTYDDAGRLLSTTWADGTVSRNEFDLLGRKTAKIDQAGVRTEFDYDALGHLVQVKDALGGVTRYTYDALSNRTSQTDANGRTTRFAFDAFGHLTNRVLPDGSSESSVYDANGHRIQRTDFAGAITNYTYDVNGRLIERTHPDGTVETIAYTATGQRAAVSDARGLTTYTYDERDRLREMTAPEGWALSFGWDAAGNRTSATIRLGTTVPPVSRTSYTYDALGRIETVTDSHGDVFRYFYGPAGRRTSLHFPNGIETSFAYDPLGRLKHIHSQTADGIVVQNSTYTLGPTGNRQSVVEEDGTTRTWDYDSLYRLSRERGLGSDGSLVYENLFNYDPVGNRQQQIRQATDGANDTITYSYDERDRLLSESSPMMGVISYGWDANGNLISKNEHAGVTTYTWDAENRLIAVALPDGSVQSNVYDFDGALVISSTVEIDAPSLATHHVTDTTDLLSQRVADVTDDGALATEYVRGTELLGLLLQGSEKKYVHADHIGSIRALTGSAGNVLNAYEYEAFGALNSHAGPLNDNPFLFAGEPRNFVSGLDYLRARWLRPATGGFVSMDPWLGDTSDPSSLHRYLYVQANPVNNTDPTGEFTLSLPAQVAVLSSRMMSSVGSHLIAIPLAAAATCTLIAASTSAAAAAGTPSPPLPPGLDRCDSNQYLIRFGNLPESAEKLGAEAAKAAATGRFPHGVSTRLKRRISGSDLRHRSAFKSTVERHFPVIQTGRDRRHHTVVLPMPVTEGTAALFNTIFTVGR